MSIDIIFYIAESVRKKTAFPRGLNFNGTLLLEEREIGEIINHILLMQFIHLVKQIIIVNVGFNGLKLGVKIL